MKIVVDENIGRFVVERLRKDGHQIKRIAEIAYGSPDYEVLEIAKRQGALLLTEDKDFGELAIRYQNHAVGVLLVRLQGFSLLEKAEIIAQTIQEHDEKLLQAFTVISPTLVRIRLYN